MHQYLGWLERERQLSFENYERLWQWSVDEPDAFWRSLWDYFELKSHTKVGEALADASMPGARWFPGVTLNYAEHALRGRDDHPAVLYHREDGFEETLTSTQLAERVGRARAGLKRLGVGKGDRVVAFLPNCPETLVAFLATASLGAIWSSTSPEFGVGSVLDRFEQIEPKVLIAVDQYTYGSKTFERREAIEEIRAGLPTLEATVVLRRGAGLSGEGVLEWSELVSEAAQLVFEPVPFDHPLWILYSSGTTGLPKAIVHGHGGILLEHHKALALHSDLGRDDRFFWFTTTGWMMWNYLVGGLLVGSTIVLYEGSPAYPDLDALWAFAARSELTYFGTSPAYLLTCRKEGLDPKSKYDLSRLRGVGSTGAPLPAEGFEWVYQHVGEDLLLGSVSGGTDICTAFVLSCPILPVHAGEIQCRGLGCRVESYDAEGNAVVDEVGELVVTGPMPSMPIYFWNDPDGQKMHRAYFERYEGVWRHADWVKITPRGSLVIYGRSDSTLNRGGVRMGTSEFYRVIEKFDEVLDSLVVDTGTMGREGELWLFLVLAPGTKLREALTGQVNEALRRTLSPRHVPDHLRQVDAIPYTLSGKKLEVPIKKILAGADPKTAANRDTLRNPAALDVFIELAAELMSGNIV